MKDYQSNFDNFKDDINDKIDTLGSKTDGRLGDMGRQLAKLKTDSKKSDDNETDKVEEVAKPLDFDAIELKVYKAYKEKGFAYDPDKDELSLMRAIRKGVDIDEWLKERIKELKEAKKAEDETKAAEEAEKNAQSKADVPDSPNQPTPGGQPANKVELSKIDQLTEKMKETAREKGVHSPEYRELEIKMYALHGQTRIPS
ncbi:MAG TPA: hypothetical protein PL019_08925 [Caldisericia bacterium]|nr:hypothetical protein [Caldisericia bacterium]